MTSEERMRLAIILEQEIGDMLRKRAILMDGYMLREVESIAGKLAFDAVAKRHTDLVGTR